MWRPPAGMTRSQRATEQDTAAGGRDRRVVPASHGEAVASIALRMPQPGRRVYAYLRWNASGQTNERYVGEVTGRTRRDLLGDGWLQVKERQILPKTAAQACAANSWATTPAVRTVMRANTRRDTKPERRLRSVLHGMGLRYRVDYPPLPQVRRRADIVFPRARLAVFVDGCFWHGCPEHYRSAKSNINFWNDKRAENTARDRQTIEELRGAGWRCLRVWEHEDMSGVAERIANLIRGDRNDQ